MKGREELASLREIHTQMVQENKNRIRGMQQSNQTKVKARAMHLLSDELSAG